VSMSVEVVDRVTRRHGSAGLGLPATASDRRRVIWPNREHRRFAARSISSSCNPNSCWSAKACCCAIESDARRQSSARQQQQQQSSAEVDAADVIRLAEARAIVTHSSCSPAAHAQSLSSRKMQLGLRCTPTWHTPSRWHSLRHVRTQPRSSANFCRLYTLS